MENFAAIDFETANEQRTSVCSVGVVIVRDGEIVDNYYSLIRPEPEYYSYWNTRVHGLTLADTAEAPVFPVVWQEIAPLIEGLPLVAHNKGFDESCLKAVFKTYCLDYPDYEFHCTTQPDRDGRLRACFVQRFHLPLCPVSERVLPNHSMAQMEK